MNDHDVNHVAALLKTMAHPFRLKILCLLQDREMSVGELREALQTTNANVSQHLAILRNKDIISYRKDANFIFNKIADQRIIELMSTMKTIFCPDD